MLVTPSRSGRAQMPARAVSSHRKLRSRLQAARKGASTEHQVDQRFMAYALSDSLSRPSDLIWYIGAMQPSRIERQIEQIKWVLMGIEIRLFPSIDAFSRFSGTAIACSTGLFC